MAENVDLKIVVSAVDETKNALKSIGEELSALGRAMGRINGQELKGPQQGLDAMEKGSKPVVESLNRINGILDNIKNAASAAGQAFSIFTSGFVALGFVRFVKEMADVAARTEVLGTVLNTVGRRAGYSQQELNTVSREVQRLGITASSTAQSLAQMVQADLDINLAPGLARASQDLAVVSGMNSSETFSRLIVNIQQMDTLGLRWMGLMIDKEKVFADAAAKAGTSIDNLNKKQVFANAVLQEADKLAGAYAASMLNVGKMITTLPRLEEILKEKLGATFLPYYAVLIKETTTLLENMIRRADEQANVGQSAFGGVDQFQVFVATLREGAEFLFEFRQEILAVGAAIAGMLAFNSIIGTIKLFGTSVYGLLDGLVALATLGKASLASIAASIGAWVLATTRVFVTAGTIWGTSLWGSLVAAVGAPIAGIIALFVGVLAAIGAIFAGWKLIDYLREKSETFRWLTDQIARMFQLTVSYIQEFFDKMWTRVASLFQEKVINSIKLKFAELLRWLADKQETLPKVLGGGKEEADYTRRTAARIEADVGATPTSAEAVAAVTAAYEEQRNAINEAYDAIQRFGREAVGAVRAAKIPKEDVAAVEQYVAAANRQIEVTKSLTQSQQELGRLRAQIREERGKDNPDRARIEQLQAEAGAKAKEVDTKQEELKGLDKQVADRRADLNKRSLGKDAKEALEAYNTRLDEEAAKIARVKAEGDKLTTALKTLGITQTELSSGVGSKLSENLSSMQTVLATFSADNPATVEQLTSLITKFQELAAGVRSVREAEALGGLASSLNKAITDANNNLKPGQAAGLRGAVSGAQANANKKGAEGDRAFNAGGVDRVAAAKALFNAETAALEQAAGEQTRIVKTLGQIQEDAYRNQYERGLISLAAYYAERRRLLNANYSTEESELLVKIAATQRKIARAETGAERVQLRSQLKTQETELALKREERAAKAKQLDQDEIDQYNKNTDDRRRREAEIRAFFDEEGAALDQINAKYDEQVRTADEAKRKQLETLRQLELRAAGQRQSQATGARRNQILQFGDADAAALAKIELKYRDLIANSEGQKKNEYEILRALELQKAERDIQTRQQQQQTAISQSQLAVAQAEADRLKARGLLTDIEYEQTVNSLVERRIDLLKQQITYYTDLYSKQTNANDRNETMQTLLGLQSQLLQLQGSTRTLGDRFRETFNDGLNQFLKDAIDKTKTMTDAWKAFRKTLSDFLLGTATKNLSDIATRGIAGIGADKDGKGGPFSILTKIFGTTGADKSEDIIAKSYRTPLVVTFDQGLMNEFSQDFVGPPSSAAPGGIAGFLTRLFGGTAASGPVIDWDLGFADGGIVRGPGTGTSDSIPAMVSNGEHIMPAEKTKKWLPLLEGIRTGVIDDVGALLRLVSGVPKFARGGIVGVPSLPSMPMMRFAAGGVVPNVSRGGDKYEVNVNTGGVSSGPGGAVPQQNLDQFGNLLGAMVQQQIVKEKRPGGLLYGG